MINENEQFVYSYRAPSAEERREIEGIRHQYSPEDREPNPLTVLRKLDRRAARIPRAAAIAAGTAGTLTFGLGLCMILEWSVIVWGVVVAAVGLLFVGCAYFLHRQLSALIKRRYAPRILELCDMLLREGK